LESAICYEEQKNLINEIAGKAKRRAGKRKLESLTDIG